MFVYSYFSFQLIFKNSENSFIIESLLNTMQALVSISNFIIEGIDKFKTGNGIWKSRNSFKESQQKMPNRLIWLGRYNI
jgi:hypothetical protein